MSLSTRTLTRAKRAALAEPVSLITQNAKVVMETTMQLTPVAGGHMQVFHRPTEAQRHVDVQLPLDVSVSCGQSQDCKNPLFL